MKLPFGFVRWFKTLLRAQKPAFLRFWGLSSAPDTSRGLGRAWKAVALRYRRWFLAENSGSYKLKRDRDQATYRLWLSHRCVFCGLPFENERITWLSGWDRGYCDSCRDDIEAREREEAEAEAKVDVYARHGVSRKDFI